VWVFESRDVKEKMGDCFPVFLVLSHSVYNYLKDNPGISRRKGETTLLCFLTVSDLGYQVFEIF